MTNKPNPFPQCGGPNQPACPPVPTLKVNFGDVIELPDGQKHVITEKEDDDNDDQ